jgi:hypothetical protein
MGCSVVWRKLGNGSAGKRDIDFVDDKLYQVFEYAGVGAREWSCSRITALSS